MHVCVKCFLLFVITWVNYQLCCLDPVYNHNHNHKEQDFNHKKKQKKTKEQAQPCNLVSELQSWSVTILRSNPCPPPTIHPFVSTRATTSLIQQLKFFILFVGKLYKQLQILEVI